MTEWIECNRTESESELAAGRRVRVKMIPPQETAPRWVIIESNAGLPCSPRKCHGLQREARATPVEGEQFWVECTRRTAQLRLAYGHRVQVYDDWSSSWQNAIPLDFEPVNRDTRFRVLHPAATIEWNPAPARKAHAMWQAGIRVQSSHDHNPGVWHECNPELFHIPGTIFRYARLDPSDAETRPAMPRGLRGSGG
jgi:hypothetical protein